MKITHNKVGQNLSVRDNVKSEKSDKVKGAAQDVTSAKESLLEKAGTIDAEASKVNLSQRAQNIKNATEIARATPDVNEEKVARLQKLIDEGKYKTDAREIANKMVDEQLSWE